MHRSLVTNSTDCRLGLVSIPNGSYFWVTKRLGVPSCHPGGVMDHIEAGNSLGGMIVQSVPHAGVEDIGIVGCQKKVLPVESQGRFV